MTRQLTSAAPGLFPVPARGPRGARTAGWAEGIPCNVLAGFHHDHLLVPVDKADHCIAVLSALRG
jgi:hypothetical protein